MNLEQAKQETSAKFNNINEGLRFVDCYLYEDLNIPEQPIRLMFGGWSEPESYLNDELEVSLKDLLRNIGVVKIFATGEKDTRDLIAWMLSELQIEHFATNYSGNRIPYKIDNETLTEIYNTQLQKFENCRRAGHKAIVDALNAELKTTDIVSAKKSRAKTDKLIWKGEQNHLVELFRTLKMRGWVDLPEGSTPTSNARAILEAFDISLTKKKPTSKEADSFIKSYIGESNKIENLYPGNPEYSVATGYEPQFDNIKPLS